MIVLLLIYNSLTIFYESISFVTIILHKLNIEIMMVAQLLSEDESQIHEIANYLLEEALIVNAMFSGPILVKTRKEDGTIEKLEQFKLQGISKSLLFPKINNELKEKYGDRMPLLYSEPIILIDPDHQDAIMASLTKV